MDSTARIVASLSGAAEEIGVELRSDGAMRDVIGLGLTEAIEALYPEADAGFVARFTEAYRRRYLHEDAMPTPLFRGVPELLEGLEAAGFLLGIATGMSRRGLDRALRESGLLRRFHATRCADESRSKPHPLMLEEVMERVGVGAGQTLVIGDSEYDMRMAGAAGVDCVGVSCGVHEPHRLLHRGALACLGDACELPLWLETR